MSDIVETAVGITLVVCMLALVVVVLTIVLRKSKVDPPEVDIPVVTGTQWDHHPDPRSSALYQEAALFQRLVEVTLPASISGDGGRRIPEQASRYAVEAAAHTMHRVRARMARVEQDAAKAGIDLALLGLTKCTDLDWRHREPTVLVRGDEP